MDPILGRPIKEIEDRIMRTSITTGIYRPKQESPHLRESSPSYTRQLVSELEEQLAMSKMEIKRKEEMIRQLSSVDIQPRYTSCKFDSSKLDSVLSSDRVSLEHAKQEMTCLQAKVDQMNQQLYEARHLAETREAEINHYRIEIDAFRETDSRQTAVIDALKQRILDLEGETCHLESTAGRTRVAVDQFQRENIELKERIVELENRLKVHLMDREKAEQSLTIIERKNIEIISQLRSIVHVDDPAAAPDAIVRKFAELVQDNAMDKTKILRLQEENESLRLEDKANRETIQRLVSEVAREQKSTLRYGSDIEKMRKDRDDAMAARVDLERELEILRNRQDHMQRQYDSARAELETHLQKAQLLERDTRETSYAARNASTQLIAFREQLASLLGDGYTNVQSLEEDIKKHVEYLKDANKDKDTHIVLLKEKLENLRTQFEEQYKLQKMSQDRTGTFEQENAELKERVRRLESDISANEVMRDGLRNDREKYLRFLEQISTVLKMDRISADTGLDLALDAILVRGEQLVKLECEAVTGRTTQVYTLQRKLKAMKEQLESKDLHLDLLRKKVTQLEERLCGRTDLDRERECDSQKVFKLEKLVERYRTQLDGAKIEIRDLKAQLLGTSEIRCENIQTSQTLNTYELQLREMRELNDQQAKKIVILKREIQARGGESEDRITRADGVLRQLTDENRQLKITLQEIRDREQELLDQRQVIARMLGLDASNLAIPAYEIIERLRRLIESNHATYLAATSSNENLLESMDEAYRAGYETAETAICGRSCQPLPGCPLPTTVVRRRCSPPPVPRHSRVRVVRARSVSPCRRVDPRAY